ncbi:MAG: hypothetical protein IJW75_01880 [Alphaproteobacteria bacterium]|nr:hypothetical protein [Alphaproteobacteria bacterium]
MDMLRKFFPFSFKEKKDIAALIINVLLYIVAGVVIGFVLGLLGLLGAIPVVGVILALVLGLVSSIVELYILVGIVLSFLDYFKVIK